MSREPPLHAVATLDARIERNHRDLVAFLARRAPNEAEELAQETWLRIARSKPNCPDEGSFRGYAFTVARRLLIDHYRRRSVRGILVPLEGGLATIADVSHDPHSQVSAGQTLAIVEQCLAQMKPEVSEVFRLRTTTGQSFKEIAASQGVTLSTALGRHHHATKQLRKALRQAGLLEGGTP